MQENGDDKIKKERQEAEKRVHLYNNILNDSKVKSVSVCVCVLSEALQIKWTIKIY